MARTTEEVDLIVKAITQGFETVAADMKRVQESTKKTESRFTEMASKMNVVNQALSMTAQTFGQVWSVLEQGAALNLAAERFDNLTASIGTTSDALLNDLGKATGGMMGNAEMIASASQIISLGLADNQKDVVDLAGLVSNLGWDMQQVIMTFANNSKMRLDALGISLTDVEQRAKALEAQGYNTDKAFDMAVIQAGQAKLELLGSAADTGAGAMKRLEVATEDMKTSLLGFIAMRSEGAIVGLANTIDAVGQASDRGHSNLRNFAVIMAEITSFRGQSAGWDQLVEHLEAQEEQTVETVRAYQYLIDQYAASAEAQRLVAEAQAFSTEKLSAYMSLESMYGRQGEEIGQSAVNSWRARQEAIAAYGETLAAGYGLEMQYAGAAQLAADQTNNAALKAAFFAEQQNLANEATAALTDRLSDSFVSFTENEEVLANYTTMMQGVATVSHEVGGRTAEQNAELDRLQGIYDKAAGTIRDYEQGLKGVNLSDEARNEKIAEQNQLMLNAQAAMGPLLGINSEYATSTDGGAAATAAMNQALYDQIAAVTEDQTVLALAGVELGIFSQAQADAMLKAALLEEEIRRQAAAWDGTAGGLEQMQVQLGNYIGLLNSMPSVVQTEVRTNYTSTGTPAASGTGATVPGVPQAMAAGGIVTGGIPGRDSVHLLAMPGEEVLSVNDPRNSRNGGGRQDNRQFIWNVYTSGFNAEREQRNANAMAGGV